jgi:uncharacterized membrane protein YqjE
MYILFASLLILLVLLVICKDGNKLNTTCVTYVVFNVLCIAAVYYWIYKEKESYIIRSNVKDISTFLL